MSYRLAWTTDIHLNFLSEAEVDRFCTGVSAIGPSALTISGDIAEAPTLERTLERLASHLCIPIYFVLGNHDFYRGAIRRVRRKVVELCQRSALLRWLPEEGLVELTPEAAMLGHDGWADGRHGDYEGSQVLLNDYLLIDELSGLTSAGRLMQMQLLAEEAATFVRQQLPAAVDRYRRVYFVTHVPPFREASWHQGGPSNDDWLPHFTSKAVGDALVEVLQGRRGCEVTVLCGHTHGRGVVRILPNLVVRTGGATYGQPLVEEVIEL